MKKINEYLKKTQKKQVSKSSKHLQCVNEIKKNIYFKEKELQELYPVK